MAHWDRSRFLFKTTPGSHHGLVRDKKQARKEHWQRWILLGLKTPCGGYQKLDTEDNSGPMQYWQVTTKSFFDQHGHHFGVDWWLICSSKNSTVRWNTLQYHCIVKIIPIGTYSLHTSDIIVRHKLKSEDSQSVSRQCHTYYLVISMVPDSLHKTLQTVTTVY